MQYWCQLSLYLHTQAEELQYTSFFHIKLPCVHLDLQVLWLAKTLMDKVYESYCRKTNKQKEKKVRKTQTCGRKYLWILIALFPLKCLLTTVWHFQTIPFTKSFSGFSGFPFLTVQCLCLCLLLFCWRWKVFNLSRTSWSLFHFVPPRANQGFSPPLTSPHWLFVLPPNCTWSAPYLSTGFKLALGILSMSMEDRGQWQSHSTHRHTSP